MIRYWLTIGLAVVLLLSACSPTRAPSGSESDVTPETSAGQPADDRSPGDPPADPERQDKPLPAVLAERTAAGLAHVTFAAGETVTKAGVYFLDTETGMGEGWQLPGESFYWGFQVSDDNRFAVATGMDGGYLIDREREAIWRWDPKAVRPLLAADSGFLFIELGPEVRNGIRQYSGRLIWSDHDMKPLRVFDLASDSGPRSAHLSPDGRLVAVHATATEIALLDLNTGDVRRFGAQPAGRVSAHSLSRNGDLLELRLVLGPAEVGTGPYRDQITRFNWQGEQVADLQLPGDHAAFSPDGRWVTWAEWPVGELAPMTVVADASTLEPRLQALGVTTCFGTIGGFGSRWLSDSSGLVVDTSHGYRLLTLDGELEERPAFSGLTWKGEPQPAPDAVDRFALGRLVVADGAGGHQQGIRLEGFVTPANLSPWGESSAELRFAVPPKPGGGACNERPPMEAKVVYPARPLPEYPLVVQGVDDCLPIAAGQFGTVDTCLPNGTRVVPVQPSEERTSLGWVSQAWRLWVRTETGEMGQIRLTDEPLQWAVE